ncbi:phosphoribosyltransferase family protein [Amycolatopsis sp. A133]|uniref:phosphoribosyltransferase family protein n=1 Tax=Amycolatopsis sp. A133 TaxID=3064472 RepID=UPI0027F60C5A|nr:phosphoribosyltransferase family protein [Amycolatopsis sp. A133]MDQ7809478.1 phosphoribosyltransferase family protein [Amycolatopsis sp. A133]
MSGDVWLEEVKAGLCEAFTWRGDRTDRHRYADVTGWWRRPELLGKLGPALARLFAGKQPTVVLGPESRGCLLGPLVALSLDVGFVEVRKHEAASGDSDAWLRRTTPPDYRDRHLRLGFRKQLVDGGDRVLFVDDWIETGGQAHGARLLTQDAEATWLGAATVVDALDSNQVRRQLNVRSLLHIREL